MDEIESQTGYFCELFLKVITENGSILSKSGAAPTLELDTEHSVITYPPDTEK